MLSGLSSVNIELTSKCHRKTRCQFCFHQANPHLQYGDMPMTLLADIRRQLPIGLEVKWHRDGDPLSYPHLGDALDLFSGGFLRTIVTHGETLYDRADELIDRCETICVSVFSPDADADLQYETVKAFLELKGARLPRLLVKVVGSCDVSRYQALGVPILWRKLHTELNDRYVRGLPVMPESGICGDFLSRPAIAWTGRVYQCVRFDDTEEGYLGNLYEQTLDEIWNGERRQQWLRAHLRGRREEANARCASCRYYGIPVAA